MNTVTIQIGNTDDKLTQKEWSDFVLAVDTEIQSLAKEVHFFGGSVNYSPWQNVCWVITIEKLHFLKDALQAIRMMYKQDSVAMTVGTTEFI